MFYLYGIILRMTPAFALVAIADWRSALLRFGDLRDKKWLLKALFRLTLPVAVKLKRFFDELCDFCLGIKKSSYFPIDII